MTCDVRRAIAAALLAAVVAAGAVDAQETAASAAAEAPAELSLDAALALLEARSPAIAGAHAALDAARAGRVIAAYRPNPTLTLGAQQIDLRHPRSHWFSDADGAAQRTWTAHIDQPLELGRARAWRMRGAGDAAEAASAQLADVRRQQRFALIQAFWAAALARDDAAVADDTLAATRDIEALITRQVEAGDRSDADLLAFQVGAAQAEQDALAARLAQEQATADALALTATRAPAGGVRVVGAPPADDGGELDADALARRALQRPDVIAARHQLDAARAAVANERAQRVLQPTVGVEYQRVGGDDAAGLTAQIPLPVLNDREGEIAQAEAQARQAAAQLEQAERAAEDDVAKAVAALRTARRAAALSGVEALDRARRSYDIAQSAYRDGATGRAELLDAQRAWNQARVTANQARYAAAVARAQIDAAVGAP